MSKTEFFFSTADYAVFDNGLGNNPEYDGERGRVKDKLEACVRTKDIRAATATRL